MKDFGKYFIFLGNLFVNRESFRTYYRLTVEECVLIGINSIMLFALVSTFMGAVTTVQTAFNLVAPYIPKYVISQVVREMAVLELAPTIMAIIYAGKVGSSMAGNLGTMRITEQVDALEVMGIRVITYLAATRIVAGVVAVVPIYTVAVLMSFLATRFGTTIIYGQSRGVYDHYFTTFLHPNDLAWSFFEALAMAAAVMAVHTYYGFTATGGPAGVGEAVGRAVRTSITAGVFILLTITLSVYGQSGNFHLAG